MTPSPAVLCCALWYAMLLFVPCQEGCRVVVLLRAAGCMV